MGWAKGIGYVAYMTQQLGLSRSTLLSLLVMVSTVAIFATGATFAITTATDGATGSVKAADISVDIDVRGTGAADALVFTRAGSSLNCPSSLMPGDFCTADVDVENTGSVPIDLAVIPPSWASVQEPHKTAGCTDASWPITVATGGMTDPLPAGATTSFVVKVDFVAGSPVECSGATAVVTINVDGSY